MTLWFWLWIAFVILVLLLPLTYGLARGWGPPYPSYYRRARLRRRPGQPLDPAADAPAWGVVADVLWVFLVLALVWLVVALLV